MVELRGFEPLTFCMPCLPVQSGEVAGGRVTAGQAGSAVSLRLLASDLGWGHRHLVRHWLADLISKRGCRS
jgi:hypothetical protein